MKRVTILAALVLAIASVSSYASVTSNEPTGSKYRHSVQVAFATPPNGETNVAFATPPNGETNIVFATPPNGETNIAFATPPNGETNIS